MPCDKHCWLNLARFQRIRCPKLTIVLGPDWLSVPFVRMAQLGVFLAYLACPQIVPSMPLGPADGIVLEC